MKKYEYLCRAIWGAGQATTTQLNEYGRQGWELVHVTWIWHYFKREI